MVIDEDQPPWSALLALQRATHLTLHVLGEHPAGLGMTGSEINALANLADGRARTVSELAIAAGTRATTMTSILDRLERRGMISRGSVPADRRAVLIALTASGQAAATDIFEAITSLEQRALAGLSADAIAGLRSGLSALAEVSG